MVQSMMKGMSEDYDLPRDVPTLLQVSDLPQKLRAWTRELVTGNERQNTKTETLRSAGDTWREGAFDVAAAVLIHLSRNTMICRTDANRCFKRLCFDRAIARFREFPGQGTSIEPGNFRSENIVAAANVNGLQEIFFPKSPYRHRR